VLDTITFAVIVCHKSNGLKVGLVEYGG